jgi:hypothetical protein
MLRCVPFLRVALFLSRLMCRSTMVFMWVNVWENGAMIEQIKDVRLPDYYVDDSFVIYDHDDGNG